MATEERRRRTQRQRKKYYGSARVKSGIGSGLLLTLCFSVAVILLSTAVLLL